MNLPPSGISVTSIVIGWMPDDVIFVDEIPHTATGKVQKTTLRERYRDFVLPDAPVQ